MKSKKDKIKNKIKTKSIVHNSDTITFRLRFIKVEEVARLPLFSKYIVEFITYKQSYR